MATSACRTIGTSARTALAATASREQHDVVAFKAGEICGEKLASGHDDDIEAGIGLVAAEQLAGETLGSVADNGPPEFPRRRDAESRPTRIRGGFASQHEHRHEAAVSLRTVLVDVLEVGPPPDSLMWLESLGHATLSRSRDNLARRPRPRGRYDTVRRFRPLARRRFRTRRPFFVLMRSRKPCVFRRRLRLG